MNEEEKHKADAVKAAETHIQGILMHLTNNIGVNIEHVEIDCRNYGNFRTDINFQ